MPIIDISGLPAAPSRRQSPEQFVAAADAHVAALGPMVAQLNAAFDQVEAAEAAAEADAQATAANRLAAELARNAAQASAELAAGYAGAPAWSAIAVYAKDAVVFSPSTRTMFRRKAAGSGGGDPAADAANWAPVALAVGGHAVWHAGNFNPANYLPLTGGTLSSALTATGYIAITAAGGVQRLLMGNQDGHGVNRPSIITAANGALNLGYGSTWAAEGGEATYYANLSAAACNFSVPLRQNGNQVWHAGNFTPSNYLPVSAGGDINFSGLNSGNPRGVRFGASGGNYGGIGYGINYTGVSGAHTYAVNDLVSRVDLFDGVNVYAADAGVVGAAVAWSEVLVARRNAFRYRGNDVWHAGNFIPSNYSPKWFDGWVGAPGVDADSMAGSKSGFTYTNRAPWTGPIVRFDAAGYDLQLNALYGGGGGQLSFRTRNGDAAAWNAWFHLWHSGNFNPAGKADLNGAGFSGPVGASRLFAGGDSGQSGSVSCSNWFRSMGQSGWFSQDYGGGIWMTDSTWLRTYGGKGLLIDSAIGGYGMLRLVGGSGSEISVGYRFASETDDQAWTVGRYVDRFFWYRNGAQRMGLFNDGTLGVQGRIFGNDVSRSGNGLGRITVSTSPPPAGSGSQGDIWAEY